MSGGHSGVGHAIAVAASHHVGATGDAVQEARPEPPSPDGATGMDMEPLSVCLAVLLGAFTLVLLVRAGLVRPGGTLARAPATARPSAPRPEAPPPRVLLSRLSVLRI
ncbi:hypothetical protein ABZ791_11195 [Streptomyces huasconensis]|uniref:Uncharacterized protein n=1 Tax=Streptomyces huasconensis TaxID=1854574 RepID=A0ABV3LPL3_9ACTN